jgi:DNA polymerase (family 10)
MDNSDYAALLASAAALIDISGGNRFRARAFERAARAISSLPRHVEALLDDDTITDLDGIGKSIAEDLRQIRARGSFDALDALRADLPEGILALLHVQGLGPKKVKALYEALHIGDLASLEAAVDSGQVAQLPGFGPKTQDNIKRELARLRRAAGRRPLPQALRAAAPVLEMLRALPQVLRAELAGSARRGRETVKDLDFVVATTDPEPVMEAFATWPDAIEVIARGPTKTSVFLTGELQADLRAVRPEHFGSLLHHFTGSKEHHVELRRRARALGLTISEYGVQRLDAADGDPPLASLDEADVYRVLGLPWIPPELREAQGEIDAAEAGQLPALLTLADLRGDLHMHSTASDGRHTIAQMALAARALGHEYIVITDHSKSSTVANGLDEARLRDHMREIDAVNAATDGILVLKGIEVDILKDGALDLPGDLLDELDFVVGSVHASMKQDRDTMTARVCRAIASGHLHCLGHPTGRLLGGRDPYPLDLEAVIDACLQHRVALEINASAGRLDLKDAHARLAAQAGVPIIISTDSHSTQGLTQMAFGVTVARRAWLTPAQVLNTRPWPDLKAWFQRPNR